MSGWRGSNPRVSAWKADAVPLGYTRIDLLLNQPVSNPAPRALVGHCAMRPAADDRAAPLLSLGERTAGIEPALVAWEATALPLGYARVYLRWGSNPVLSLKRRVLYP